MSRSSVHRLLAMLGLVAALLLATMPTLSRIVQAAPRTAVAHAGHAAGSTHAMHHGMAMREHGHGQHPVEPVVPGHPGHDPVACGYCVLPPVPLPEQGIAHSLPFVPDAPWALAPSVPVAPAPPAVPALGSQAPPRA